MDDAFTLNCRPTVPVGCEELVVDVTRPLLPLVKGLAPRLVGWYLGQYIDRCIIRGKPKIVLLTIKMPCFGAGVPSRVTNGIAQ